MWLALPFGLIITITCLTGALLAFEQETYELCFRSRYFVSPTSSPRLPLDSLLLRAAPELPDSVQITGITIPADSTRAYTIQLSKPRRAGLLIDPYRGIILGRNERSAFFGYVFRLHRWLLDSPKDALGNPSLGRIIVGSSTIGFALILITGLLAWLPKRMKGLSKLLKIHTRYGTPRLLHELHTVGGVYALLFLLIMCLTGPTWSFDWYRRGFYQLLGAELKKEEMKSESKDKKSTEKSLLPEDYKHWEAVYHEVKEQHYYTEVKLSSGEAQGKLSSVGNPRAADLYSFDTQTGQILALKSYDTSSKEQHIKGWIYALHTGAWGGWLTKVLYAAAALLGVSLPLTGYYLYYRRVKRSKSKR